MYIITTHNIHIINIGSMLALSCDGNSTLYHESGASLRIYDQGNLSYFPKSDDSFQVNY